MRAVVLALLAAPAAADTVYCDDHWGGSLSNIIEPLEDHTRSFAQGDVRVLILASPEPACCGVFVAVLLPEVEGYRTCRLLTGPGDMGWGGARFAGEASYDPTLGLLVPVEVSTWDGEAYDRTFGNLRINQATGEVVLGP